MSTANIDFDVVEESIRELNTFQNYYRKSLEEGEKYENEKLLAQFYIKSAEVNYLLHFFQDTLSDLKKASVLLERVEEPYENAKLDFLLGQCYTEFSNFDHADLHLKKALRVAQKENYAELEIEVLESLGLLFSKNDYPQRAFKFLELKREKLADAKKPAKVNLAQTFLNIGKLLRPFDLFKSLSLIFQAKKIFEEESFNKGVDQCLIALGWLFLIHKSYEEAKYYFHKATEISHNEKALSSAYFYLAEIAETQNKPKLSLQYLREYNQLNQRLNAQLRLRDNKATKKQFEVKKIFDEGKLTQATQQDEVKLVAQIQKKNELIERLTMVAEQTDNVVVITDPEGNFEWANERFEIRSGMKLKEFIKTRGGNIKDASYNDDISDILNQCIDSSLPVNYNSFYRLENNDIRYQSSKICPIYDDDNLLKNFVVIDSDITEIRRVQNMIQQKNKDITDSINYAKRIQEAILPSRDCISSDLGDAFVLFHPRDIVSGDFYWLTRVRDHILFAVCDCTGHGVPGAFMSMIGNDYLTQIVVDDKVSSPGQTLGLLDEKIVSALKQTGKMGEAKDGMDAALCAISFANYELEFSGAKRPLIIIRDDELIEVKGSNYSIGGNQVKNKYFESHNMSVQKGDMIYIFSDGYHDQFGGVNGKKFSLKRLKNILLEIHKMPVKEQKQILQNSLDSWRGDTEQVDDICLIGLKV